MTKCILYHVERKVCKKIFSPLFLVGLMILFYKYFPFTDKNILLILQLADFP